MKVDVFTEPPRWRRLRRRKVYRERSLLMTVESAVEAAVGSRAAAVYWAWKDAA